MNDDGERHTGLQYRDGLWYGHFRAMANPCELPVRDAPRPVTVAADTCTQAGMLATLAMLRGREAESWLDAAGVQSWCLR